MKGYLIDTNVVSTLFPTRLTAMPGFIAWLETQNASGGVFLPAVTVQEIAKGAEKLAVRKDGSPQRAARIYAWLDGLLAGFEDVILPIDKHVAYIGGQIEGHALGNGHTPALADVLIAATARVHDLTVITFDSNDFRLLNCRVELPASVEV